MANEEHLAKLKAGVEALNQWRKLNTTTAPHLSFANLSGSLLRKANLSKADLAGANLSKANLTLAFLDKAVLNLALLFDAPVAVDRS